MTDATKNVAEVIAAARRAQADWAALAPRVRVKPIGGLRHELAADPSGWASLIQTPQDRTTAESLASEVLPLADACRWLERHAARTLRPRVAWRFFQSLALRVERKPAGVVLVIGASNYPLFLLAVPAIQALAAGNAVLLKPPPGGEAIAQRLANVLVGGGDSRLCVALDSSTESAQAAIAAGVDHITATGSSATGRAVARAAAETLTPCTLECSGSDAVIVLPGANLRRVVDCVAWGLTFNAGATCIGPRRLIAVGDADEVRQRLADRLANAPPRRVPKQAAEALRRVLGDELAAGAMASCPHGFDRVALDAACDAALIPPILLTSALASPLVAQSDLFAPVLSLDVAKDAEQAIELANASSYALGASVFGPAGEAEEVARRLRAGCVTVNDLIAPTADPRVPFGGAGESGYGVTRGAEGLLAMTRPQAVVRRRGGWLPHLDEPTPALDDLVTGLIQSQHAASWSGRFAGLKKIISAATRRRTESSPTREP
ncbi:Coniferyl aldehyde dehydrogenase [Botrimarina colliarenosi]|uniref:Coniferyl aldehyde dehydrogenase n=1 Tax=Botrimarina colliarenosi TaxID=2528001 RepID=A0A5C6AMX8_9BACT|nr:aldehyde dehydrogenase family protein [Botrimarina colliarenosi]TWU00362.1 Coniferyl aldehyde dehydrogenase [Botrimarina colliarenosi]